MALRYESFADSKPFKFVVGETGKTFYIHASLAAQQSTTLATLIEGGMVESEREYAAIEDVDEDTFIRFIQFAYTGDYAVAETVVVLSPADIATDYEAKNGGDDPSLEPVPEFPNIAEVVEEPVPEAPPEEPAVDFGWGNFGSTTHRNKSRKTKRSAWAVDRVEEPVVAENPDFRSKGERLWDEFKAKAQVKYADVWQPSVNSDPCEDYTPVFLCHAKLYMFSDKYSIEPLLELVLQKLRLNLSKFELHSERVADIVELMKYVYEHTTDYENAIDRLRNLVTDYVVCHIEKVMALGDFMKLLQENGDVAKDLMPKLMQRLE
ncbi:hypothetical protein H2200_011462 [Cladophialophora chaetospira]|uniref:BTB domain-containing protein n=1 Tax=Cladophialophora chaetospira TaxID=386627 RepID=A0AA38WZE0_9EURO|nr:hypothetical protein H2200_011462 [Cladophialophora chaetospira]